MNAVLIALFVSASAHGLPPAPAAGIDAPSAPVRSLAGKAKQIDAVASADAVPGSAGLKQPAIHSTGEKKPAFNPGARRPIA